MRAQDQTSFLHIAGLLGLWGMAYLCVHIIHFRFFIVDVVFYAAFFDVLLSAVLLAVVYFAFLKKFLKISWQNLVLSSLFGIACGYIFAITIPTVIDRSLSAYILEKLVQRGGAVREDALDEIFVKEYIPEFKLMDVRLQEALSSGTVVIEAGCIRITPKGKRVAGFTRFYRRNFLPKKRRLMGEVTDVLVNPFKDSSINVGYICASAMD